MLPGRTTSAAVEGIIEADVTLSLDAFIDSANELVTEICAIPAAGYSPYRLELIERWLAAHFYCMEDPQATMERIDVAQASYEGQSGMGLRHSRYGQQAMRLDTFGGLAVWDNGLEKFAKAPKGLGISAGATYIGSSCPPRNNRNTGG